MSKVQRGKCCMVCGDRALGFNFNAITCESCKAFFRRNALSDKKIACPFSNNCEINAITRRFCQRCRLEKCFQVGMKKEFIMSEEDKELKRKKIEQNRNKRKLKNVTAENSSSSKKFDDLEDSVITKKSVKVRETYPPSPSINADSTSSFDIEESEFSEKYQNISSTSSVEQIVEAIIETKNPTQIIQKIMKTQAETLDVMGRVIQSPQALILISHFIKNPSDGMMIISKMMDSPLDALNVFSRFMSTPTDALQIIFKIISSPTEVLQFMTELTKNPNQGLDIMKRFMASPSDILDSLLKILMNSMTKATTTQTSNEEHLSKLDFSGIESPQSMNGSLYSPRTNNSDFENFNLTDNNEQQMLNEFNQETKNVSFENSMISIINQAIKLEYNTNTSSGSHALNEQEMGKIQELIDSNRALHDPIDEDLSTLFDSQLNALEPGVHPSLTKVINLTAIAIRRLIQMSKKISGFKKLCQEDQIALLKGGCTEMMILRSILQYDSRHEVWDVPHSTNSAKIKTEILKLCSKGNIYEEHEHFIKTFDGKLRTDEKIIMLLCAITLFNPERPYVVHAEVIKLEQSTYYYLLQRYLENIYEGCEAKSMYLKILQKLQEVKKLNEDIVSVYLDVNPTEVEPLLREIFDLKV